MLRPWGTKEKPPAPKCSALIVTQVGKLIKETLLLSCSCNCWQWSFFKNDNFTCGDQANKTRFFPSLLEAPRWFEAALGHVLEQELWLFFFPSFSLKPSGSEASYNLVDQNQSGLNYLFLDLIYCCSLCLKAGMHMSLGVTTLVKYWGQYYFVFYFGCKCKDSAKQISVSDK